MTFPLFSWPRFLTCFIAAPLLVTLLSFWAFIPVFALIFGGPFYLLVGLPVAAWYLRQPNPRGSVLIMLAVVASFSQIPAYGVWAALTGDWGVLDALPAFLIFGGLFAVLWTGSFVLLYRVAAAPVPPAKETQNV